MEVYKFGHVVDGEDVPFTHPNTWAREKSDAGRDRLKIAPSKDQVELVLMLTELLSEPFGVLYVLIVPRGQGSPARYQSPLVSREDMKRLFTSFRELFEGDGRAHVWVASVGPSGVASGTLVYDRHDTISAHGPLQEYEEVLTSLGLTQAQSVELPCPHVHRYNKEFDSEVDRLFKYGPWIESPLHEGDDD